MENKLQEELDRGQPDQELVGYYMDQVRDVKYNAPIAVAIVALLAAVLMSADGVPLSVGRAGGIEGAISELRLPAREAEE